MKTASITQSRSVFSMTYGVALNVVFERHANDLKHEAELTQPLRRSV